MGTLYSVATPIGNLKDITYRAVEILRTVDIILCEDTRTSRRLMQEYDITTRLQSYHQHSSAAAVAQVVEQLQAGKNYAVITDAGTPTISDPGVVLVQAALAAGVTVEPIPGPSAVIAALQVAGVPTHKFTFFGFLPHKKGRQTLLKEIGAYPHTAVLYESPHRLLKTLTALQEYPDKHIVVAKELTKLHEEWVRGSAQEVLEFFSQRDKIKGEYVVIVTPAAAVGGTATPR